MNELYCIGCGAKIQSDDEKSPGYVPSKNLEKSEEEILCKRCFRLRHYNEITDVNMSSDDYLKLLRKISEDDALVLMIVDIFDFTGSFIPGINRHTGSNNLIVVGNKIDLLPKSSNHNRLKNWMRRLLKEYGLKPIDVSLISSLKGHGIDNLMELIESYRKNRNVYVVGCTNVGKSSLINRIIKNFTDVKEDVITTSHFPGTTLDMISIPLDNDNFIIDTPGIINEHQYAHYISPKSLKLITPKKEIKPIVNQLNPNQTLFYGGLARVDFTKGNRCSFVSYMPNSINIHRTKLEKADELFINHKGELLSPPNKEEIDKLPKMVKQNFVTPDYKCDIVISGLGFISINQKDSHITVHAPSGVGVFIRQSII